MSSTYLESASGPLVARRSRRGSRPLGLGAVLAGVAAVGAAVAIVLVPVEAPTTAPAKPLPAMDASMGFWDRIDTRPAISRSDASMGFWDFVSYPAPRELPAMDASMGFWDWIDTRPAVSRSS